MRPACFPAPDSSRYPRGSRTPDRQVLQAGRRHEWHVCICNLFFLRELPYRHPFTVSLPGPKSRIPCVKGTPQTGINCNITLARSHHGNMNGKTGHAVSFPALILPVPARMANAPAHTPGVTGGTAGQAAYGKPGGLYAKERAAGKNPVKTRAGHKPVPAIGDVGDDPKEQACRGDGQMPGGPVHDGGPVGSKPRPLQGACGHVPDFKRGRRQTNPPPEYSGFTKDPVGPVMSVLPRCVF